MKLLALILFELCSFYKLKIFKVKGKKLIIQIDIFVLNI